MKFSFNYLFNKWKYINSSIIDMILDLPRMLLYMYALLLNK